LSSGEPERVPVTFYSGPGLLLSGVVTYPQPRTGGPYPAVVLCNGFMGGKHIYMPRAAEVFARHGYASLAFDYRGFGDSEGPRWRLIPEEQADDIRNALSWIAADPAVDAARLALWGTSLGASHALTVAATDPRVRCVIANAPLGDGARQARFLRSEASWADFQRRLEADRRQRVLTGRSQAVHPFEVMPYDEDSRRRFEASLPEYPERLSMRFPLETADRLLDYVPESRVARIAPRPLLIIAAENDALTPLSEQRRIFELAGEPKRLAVIGGATHYGLYSAERFDEVLKLTLGFLDESLGGAQGSR
jgi:alpha-beta hydrolase superfamily lysophospholipase